MPGNTMISETDAWVDVFFDDKNIANTLHAILKPIGFNVEDLTNLCICAHNTDLIPSLSLEGLMPFRGKYMYTLPYSAMNKNQLRTLKMLLKTKEELQQYLKCYTEQDFCMLLLGPTHKAIEDDTLLYGAHKLMKDNICTTHVAENGHIYSRCVDKSVENKIINDTLFRIVNSCSMSRSALHSAAQKL